MRVSIKTMTVLFGFVSITLLWSYTNVSAQQDLVQIDESVRESFEIVSQDNLSQQFLVSLTIMSYSRFTLWQDMPITHTLFD